MSIKKYLINLSCNNVVINLLPPTELFFVRLDIDKSNF